MKNNIYITTTGIHFNESYFIVLEKIIKINQNEYKTLYFGLTNFIKKGINIKLTLSKLSPNSIIKVIKHKSLHYET